MRMQLCAENGNSKFERFFFALSVISVTIHNKSMSASNRHTEGCAVQRFKNNGRFYVLRGGECVAGTVAAHFEDGRNVKNQRTG